MCGIAGLANWGDVGLLTRLTDAQAHRGPDDRGVWESHLPDGRWIGLGSRRLAILDLTTAGHMPMSTPDGRLTIVYNGEIYNSPQLRGELEAQGFRFRSRTDTEVILYLYAQHGLECLRRLNGMFAFAVWDQRERQLVLARDHFGIKPLYYYRRGASFAFASELKALLQHPEIPREINLVALNQYLTFLWVPEPLTMFEGILKLPAGHFAVLKGEEFSIHQYWDLALPSAGLRSNVSEEALTDELRSRVFSSVRSQMLSDVPLGAFLSSGLDSSSIVAAMAQATPCPVHTYTITFPARHRKGESILDDAAVARRTAERFGCNHTEIMVEPDVVALLPKLIWHMDDPVADPATIAAYLVSREARKSVTVLLSGVGGDELFAGYRKYRAHYLASYYQRIPWILRRRLIEPVVGALPSFRGTALKDCVRLLKKMVRSGSLPPRERFLTDSVYFSENHKTRLLTPEMQAARTGQQPWHQHLGHFHKVADADFLHQMLYLDIKTFMVSLNLSYNDRMSMANSLEVRVPFLDWELADWAASSIPPELKLHGRTSKYILRKAMGPLLPNEVLTQKKAGFGAPVDYWLSHDLWEMANDLLNEQQVRRRGFFNPTAVRQLLNQQETRQSDWSLQIWQLLTLELWMQAFIDSKSQTPEDDALPKAVLSS